jgi:hypothetical protein
LRLAIVHQIAERTRLRVHDGSAGDADWPAFAERLAAEHGIDAVDFRPHTGSLVVDHPGLDAAGLVAVLTHLGAAVVAPGGAASPASGLVPVRRGLDRADSLLSQITAGGLDVRTLTFAVLVGLAVRQLLRGQVMVPALSLLTWAVQLLPRELPVIADAADADGD